MKLQSELDFIQHLDVDLKAVLRRPQWLFSDFDAPVWEVSLEYKKPFPIDWQVMIGDHLLTAPQNKELFGSFRYFLVCSVDGTNGQSKTSIDEKRKSFSEALTIIDYFIMHADTLELEACGLSGITASNLSTLLYQYSTHPFSSESIYEYTKQAAVHITAITAETDPKHIARVMVRYPSIEDLRDGDDSAPPEFLDSSLVPYIRAALFSHGYYRGSPGEGFHLNGKTISDLIYKGTLAGSRIKPRLHWMSFFPYEQSYTRELPMVPVRFSGNGVISEPNLRSFRSTLYRLGALHRLNLTAPQPHDLESILKLEIPTADDKCYRSVPSKIILDQFKNCVEFHFKYGRIIIDGFCRVAAYSKANSVPMHQIGDQTLQKIIGPELLKLGVKTLGLSCKRLKKNKNKPPKTEYYAKLRQNEGLI
ncbi:hypothetical protein [Pseudomonas monteilii]|uniref:hypothetical protein n=1 Tax=Pseudomonas monteilii TaxID=76759 RepID=UPI0007622287|nr:hypothetical protein [Pseudomonas monteilii]